MPMSFVSELPKRFIDERWAWDSILGWVYNRRIWDGVLDILPRGCE